jgi:flavin reductase (DIM6/NTAB) family NADH-FMN oxidoreductase RutF
MDPQAKKTLLRKLPHGVYIVGVAHNGQRRAFTGTWLTQVSFTPPLVALGVRKDSGSLEMIKAGGSFSVNLLGKGQKSIAEHFVKPAGEQDKLAGVATRPGATGSPVLEEAIGYFECRVREIANEHGDHAIVIGEVVEAKLSRDEPTLTLLDTGWHYGG